MALATPSNARLKLTPSNSPYLGRPSRSPMRGRAMQESHLALKRVIGTTCRSPTGFDTGESCFAYVAGAAVVVVDVKGDDYCQRFFRARPTAQPIYPLLTAQPSSSTPTNTTPKANDSRNRMSAAFRESPFSQQELADTPGSKTWTSRERIKAATCVALSPDGKYLAVGETGYAPRVLIFSLQDASSDTPLVSISEHTFGVNVVAWSPDSRYLASLGSANDGFLYIWKIDQRNGQARLFQQNRCTSFIKDMIWMGSNLITLGVRHVKFWKIDEAATSPTRNRYFSDVMPSTPPIQKSLPGRNVLLGSMLEATFSCAAADGTKLIMCTEAGDVCIMDDDDRQMKILKVLNLGFSITTINIRDNVAFVGGKNGNFATLDVVDLMDGREDALLTNAQPATGIVAMGFLTNNLVTIDSKQSIHIWNPDYRPCQEQSATTHIKIPGHGEAVMGVHRLPRPNKTDASFLTWSGSGEVIFWDMEGRVKQTIHVPFDAVELDSRGELSNQLVCVKTARNGKHLIVGDRLGVLKVIDVDTKECILDTKAHGLYCINISIFEEYNKMVMATCGRDRTAQLFYRHSSGRIEHFQTLEFSSRVVQVLIPSDDKVITCSMDRALQVHDIVRRQDDPDMIAAIPTKVIALKGSPTSIAMGPDNKSVFVSLLDRSLCQFDLATGKQVNCFKSVDEGGTETAVLDHLSLGNWPSRDLDFLLSASNTDKSIRMYDANTGSFLDREWGHTEAINGVSIIEDDEGGAQKVVSVGSDGTIMIWYIDFNESSPRSSSRDPSPVKNATVGRQTLRRVLSRAEIAEFQRPPPSQDASGRRSPPRTIRRRTSRLALNTSANINTKTPTTTLQASPNGSAIMEDTPSRRRPDEGSRPNSPPSPKVPTITRRPSLPAMSITARKKTSLSNLRSTGTLNTATEQACRTLRAYRRKLTTAEPITAESLTELDQELRLTAAALGDRAIRSKAMNETVLSGLLDQYSERLITLLDEKLKLTSSPKAASEEKNVVGERRGSADDSSVASSS